MHYTNLSKSSLCSANQRYWQYSGDYPAWIGFAVNLDSTSFPTTWYYEQDPNSGNWHSSMDLPNVYHVDRKQLMTGYNDTGTLIMRLDDKEGENVLQQCKRFYEVRLTSLSANLV